MEENSVDLLSRILDEAKEEMNHQKKEPPKRKKSKLWAVFFAISIFLFADCIFLLISNWIDHENLQSQVETLQKRYQTASTARDKYMEQAEAAKDELSFWRENAVIVTEEGEKYHTYGCQYIADRKATILFYETAESKGYTPCSVCLPDGLGGRLIYIGSNDFTKNYIEEKESYKQDPDHKAGINWDEVLKQAEEIENELKEKGIGSRTIQ